MARELALNPDKLEKIDNHGQETWKAPLPEFIEEIYFKRFKREEPIFIRSLKDIISDDKALKENKRKQKNGRKQKKNRTIIRHPLIHNRKTRLRADFSMQDSVCTEKFLKDNPLT